VAQAWSTWRVPEASEVSTVTVDGKYDEVIQRITGGKSRMESASDWPVEELLRNLSSRALAVATRRPPVRVAACLWVLRLLPSLRGLGT
jgi:hypothetical protein